MNFSWKLPSHNRPTPHAYAIPAHDIPPPPPPPSSTNTVVEELDDPILYNRVYRIHICTTHRYALRNLARHLLNEHTLSPRRRKEIIAAHADDDCVPPERIESPIELVDPIEGLAAPVTVYQCQDNTCRVIQGNHDNIRKHANREHGWRKSRDQPAYWNVVQAQTFFTSRNLIKYFVVRADHGETHHLDANRSTLNVNHSVPRLALQRTPSHLHREEVERIKLEWSAARARYDEKLKVMDEETMKQDRTGWYKHTEWPEHLAKRNLRFLAHASRLPDRDEVVLQEAVRVLDLVLQCAVVGLSTLEQELRRWLRSAKQAEPDVRPFSRLQEPNSQDRYHGYMRRFLCLVLRVWLSSQDPQQLDQPNLSSSLESQPGPITETRETLSESEDDSEDDDDQGMASGSESEDESDTVDQEKSIDPMKDARELFPWQGEQWTLVSQLYDQLTTSETTLNTDLEGISPADKALMQAMLRVFQSFIFQKVGGQQFKSGLIHFLAVLGIDEDNNRLRRASDFSYMLAGVVYCVRLLGVEILLPSQHRDEQEDDDNVRERFLEQRRQYLADGSGTPMSKMLSLLAYSKHIAMNTGNAGSVSWSRDKKTLYFRGRAIEIALFRKMVVDAIGRAEDMLWRDLMWVEDVQDRFEVDLHSLVDDVTFTRRGISFINKSSNGLSHGLDWMLERMLSQPPTQRLRTQGHWRARRIRRYLRRVDDFLRLLLFCVHTTSGQPARGTEITSIRFQNGCLQDRNVFVIDGQVVIVTRYHKSQSQYDRPKVVPRFTPWRVGQMTIIYLAFARRLREHLLVQVEGQGWSDHIWCNDKGIWDTDRMTSIIRQETAMGIRHGYTTLDYRHIAVSIGRVTVGESFASGYKEEIGEVEEPEVDEESGLDLQSGRGEKQGSLKYGVPVDIIAYLSVRSLETFRPLSEGWHQFLGLKSTVTTELRPANPATETSKRARTLTNANENPPALWRPPFASTSSLVCHRPSSPDSPGHEGTVRLAHATGIATVSREEREAQVAQAMRRLFGGDATGHAKPFRSREQEEGVNAVLRQESPVVVVLPTGGGKTVLAMVPALLDAEGVTVIVAPFRALVDDMVRRFRQAGIDCREWRFGEVNPATVVVVSADIAASYGFLSYARELQRQGFLRRIFIDECHLTFTSSDWRPKLWQLRQLRTLSCPMILLTATLPPLLVFELEEIMLVRNARLIRGSTIRAQHRYQVQICRPGALLAEAVKLCLRRKPHLRRQKGVVYCLAREDCRGLAEELDCPYYHAGVVDRAEKLQQWSESGGLIVATSALGTGVDFPGIVFVLHVGMPWSMIDFAQESGRAGRGGELVDSIILVEANSVESKMQRAMLALDTSAMATFITTPGCRRQMMSEYLDGPDLARSCGEVVGAAHCDRCGEGAAEAQRAEQVSARQWQAVRRALDDMAEGCAWCWIERPGDEGVSHGMLQCPRETTARLIERSEVFRRQIVYRVNSHSCTRCGISQKYCATGQDGSTACQWPNVMVAVVYLAMGHAMSIEILRRLGYDGEVEDWGAYARWVGQRHVRRRWGEWMSNGMVVLIEMILYIFGIDE